MRDSIAEKYELTEYLNWTKQFTPETMNDPDYQSKSKAFSEELSKEVFEKTIDLAPLWPLTLDLSSPDGHAKSFLEGANLSADDVMKLEESGIVHIIYPVEEKSEALPAEEENRSQESDDVLVPNEDN